MSQAEISVPTASGKDDLTWVTLGWRNGVSKGCVQGRRWKLGRGLHVVEHNRLRAGRKWVVSFEVPM